jgi:hypothetical protein
MAARQKLLAGALQSLADQQTDVPFEVVIVVDGPQSLTRADIGHGDLAIVLCNLEVRKGRSAAANQALTLAAGEFLNFLDDDDRLLPQHIDRLVEMLQRDPDAVAAYAAAQEIEADLDLLDPSQSRLGPTRTVYNPPRGPLDLLDRNLFPIQAVMFRRELLKSGVQMSPLLDALEDWLFWQEMLVGRRLVHTAEITSEFHVPLSIARKAERLDTHRSAELVLRDLQRYARVPMDAVTVVASRSAPRPKWLDRMRLRAGRRLATSSSASRLIDRAEAAFWQVARHGWRLLRRPRRPRAPSRPAVVLAHPRSEAFRTNIIMPTRTRRRVVFTSCNCAYLDKALALAESVKRHIPDCEFHLLLADRLGPSESLCNVDRVYPASNLDTFAPAWVYKHSVVELSTAVKPAYFAHLLDEGYSQVLYLDPDTVVYRDLTSVWADLAERDVLLTPHLHRPAKSSAAVSAFEVSSLAHGIFNLGFLAANNSASSREVIDYWRERCAANCFGEIHRGVFTDQKWANSFPIFFPDAVGVSRNPGLNAAVWNLEDRSVTRDAGNAVRVDDSLLELFHFSGWDAGVPRRFSGTGVIAELVAQYERSTALQAAWRRIPWAYGSYDSGEPIRQAHRICYRRNADLEAAFPYPYATGPGSLRDWITAKGDVEIDAEYGEEFLVRRAY